MPTSTSPAGEPRDQRSWPRRHKILTGLAVLVAIGAGASIASGGHSPAQPAATQPAATQPARPSTPEPATPAPARVEHTVTYRVTGSAADVTWGPAGSSYSGTVPMSRRVSLADTDAAYYAITAQLQGGGSATCSILMDGRPISTATATGGYNIATCEVVRNPISGQWEDVNAR